MRDLIRRFIRDEDGQSTTEYIMILALVMIVAMQFKKQFQGTIGRLVGGLSSGADKVNSDLMNELGQ